jgi:hypothetical protein
VDRAFVPSRLAPARTSKVARVIISAGLPAPGAVGVRLTLEPGERRTAVPVRSVIVRYGQQQDAPLYIPPTRLVIVGAVTMPAAGSSGIFADHTSMGTGALVSAGIEPAAYRQAQLSRDPTLNGPSLVFVKLRSGSSPAAGLAGLQRIVNAANRAFAAVPDSGGGSYDVAVLGVQRPAEIVNYRTMGAAPVILAAGALAALALTLAASVRRRRRDLALLKMLGFTRGQLAGAVAWQATVAAVIGIGVGVPAGVALGRGLWVLFAQAIYTVPEPTVPVLQVILIALGALVLANIAAAIPGRLAARNCPAHSGDGAAPLRNRLPSWF